MGIRDKIKGFIGGDDEPDDGFVDEGFEEEEFEEFEEVEDEEEDGEFEEVDEEDDMLEWDTAYQCADDLIQEKGFTDVNEFISKAMAWRVKNSPMYRDRFETGAQTAQMIEQTASSIENIGSSGDGEVDYGEMADQLEDANRFVEEVESFADEEGKMARDILSTANRAINVFAGSGGSPGGVNTGVKESEEKL